MVNFGAHLHELRSELLSRAASILIEEQSDARIERALDWLVERQDPTGGFGSGGSAESAFSVFAILAWRKEWRESEGLRKALSYLEEKIASGEATETFWDEAVVLRVLLLSPEPAVRRSAVERAVSLVSRVVSGDQKAHHLSQSLMLAREASLPTDALEAALAALDIGSVGSENAYVRGQVLWAKAASGMDIASLRDEESWLIAWIQKTDPTKGNFQDFCAALIGLAAVGSEASRAQIVGRVDRLFDSALQRPTDWSWYHFAWETSWALLALRAVGSASRIQIPTTDVLSLISKAEVDTRKIEDELQSFVEVASGPTFWRTVALSAGIGGTIIAAVAITLFRWLWPDGTIFEFFGEMGVDLMVVWGGGALVTSYLGARLRKLRGSLAKGVLENKSF